MHGLLNQVAIFGYESVALALYIYFCYNIGQLGAVVDMFSIASPSSHLWLWVSCSRVVYIIYVNGSRLPEVDTAQCGQRTHGHPKKTNVRVRARASGTVKSFSCFMASSEVFRGCSFLQSPEKCAL